MIILLILKLDNLKIGRNLLLNINMMQMFHISIFWYQLVILSNINTFLINYLVAKKMYCYRDKLVLGNPSLLVTFSVILIPKDMHTQSWIFQLKQVLKMCWMSFLIKINSQKKEELKLDHLVVKKWFSMSMILICLHYKNMVPNHPINYYDKLSTKKDFTT